MTNTSTAKPAFLNFKVDHMTLLVAPEMYAVTYAFFRTIFGVQPEDILYNKTKEWVPGEGQRSMTFANLIGSGLDESKDLDKTIVAVVQPTEPENQASHVRQMLATHSAAAHWQHIALRTPDLVAFHQHAEDLGVNFITPILKDDGEDLIQVFSGEWYFPGSSPSAMFFEFVQRNPSESSLKLLEERNRESWFKDKTFMGLYGEKETEYQSGNVKPFVDFALFDEVRSFLNGKEVHDISEDDIKHVEGMMRAYAKAQRNA